MHRRRFMKGAAAGLLCLAAGDVLAARETVVRWNVRVKG